LGGPGPLCRKKNRTEARIFCFFGERGALGAAVESWGPFWLFGAALGAKFKKTKNPKTKTVIQKPKHPKTEKTNNPKNNPKTQKPKNPKTKTPQKRFLGFLVLDFRCVFGFLGFLMGSPPLRKVKKDLNLKS